MKLAFMAGGDVGLDILHECWPLEVVKDGPEGRVEAFVSKVVMCFEDCCVLLVGGEDKLVSALLVLLPESSVVNGEGP